MKRLFFGIVFSGLVLVAPISTMAGVNMSINISQPSPIEFKAPPEMIVIPETYAYVVPDVDEDLFFYNGWWYRPWEKRWYRSRNYSSGWTHYRDVPSFYKHVPPEWRNDFREHRWKGHQWDYQRIPHKQVQGKWSYWKKTNHWKKQKNWGVQDLHLQTQSRPQPQQATPNRSQQHRKAEPQGHDNQSQQSHQRQGNHENGNTHGNGKK